MDIGGLFGRLAADFARHRRQVLACLFLSLAVLAPFVVRLSNGAPQLKVDHLWLAVALCALAIVSRLLFGLACLLLLVAAVILQHIGRHWGKGQLDARLDVLYEAPGSEIFEYLHSHVDGIDALFLAGAAGLAALLWVVLRTNSRPVRMRLAGAVIVALALGFALLKPGYGISTFPPFALAKEVVASKSRLDRLSRRAAFLTSEPMGAVECRIPYDKIVVVLGESAVSDHMGMFGYARPTTPFASRSGAHAFDALSPSNQTRISLALMLTRTAPEAFEGFYRTHSLVSELRACGFRTTWISNQGRRGSSDSFSSSIAAEADEQVFLNELSWKDVKLDGAIVGELESRGVFRRSRQATFVHLIGSHSEYDKRYPEGFGFPNLPDTVSQYDNSILYTDHVLSDLYRRFAGGSLLFIYVSDHGQVVSNGLHGSGFSPGYQEEFRAPLLVWTADTAAIETLRRAIGGSRVNLESFDDIVRYLSGLSTTLEVSSRSTVSVLTPGNLEDYRELGTFAEETARP